MAQPPADEDRLRLVRAFESSQLRIEQLWLAYFALGGGAGRYELEAYLAGLMPLTTHEHNVLAQAVKERLAELSPRDGEAPPSPRERRG